MNKKKKKKFPRNIILIKVLIIAFFVFGFYYTNNSYNNEISLLAINEDSSGNPVSGSIIDLNLIIKPGSGQIYTNLNTIEEVDTQISIINSQKIACNLFELDCSQYDFFYNFEGSALLLKGPSASSAIAILVTKTVKKEKVNKDVVITGSLNSGGVIGNVGGVEKKIEIAQDLGFKKVLIPVFSDYDKNKTYEIEVIKVIDIIDAYNNYNGFSNYNLKSYELKDEDYKRVMKNLGEKMCLRAEQIQSQINLSLIEENSSFYTLNEIAKKSFNSSINAKETQNYYSQGSFCYNSNLNYRTIFEMQKNLSLKERENIIQKLKLDIDLKYVILSSNEYKENIKTINDFYVYLLLMDRIEESREFLKEANNIQKEDLFFDKLNITKNNTLNNQTDFNNNNNLTNNLIKLKEKNINQQKTQLYSYALERFYTVELWEELIVNSGENIKFNDKIINDACVRINREITIKSQLLKNYNFGLFNSDIEKQLELGNLFSNRYLCIYNGLELNARINTILNTIGISNEVQENYTKELINITNSRIGLNNKGDFPLIPYIYFEYSQNLFEQGDYSSSLLYSNYALSYTDLNIYLEKEYSKKSFFNKTMIELFNGSYESLFFLGALLTIAAFLI